MRDAPQNINTKSHTIHTYRDKYKQHPSGESEIRCFARLCVDAFVRACVCVYVFVSITCACILNVEKSGGNIRTKYNIPQYQFLYSI